MGIWSKKNSIKGQSLKIEGNVVRLVYLWSKIESTFGQNRRQIGSIFGQNRELNQPKIRKNCILTGKQLESEKWG